MKNAKKATINCKNKTLADLRDFLKNYRKLLEENANKIVDEIVNYIYDTVLRDPAKYLLNSVVTITIDSIDDGLTGPAQYSIEDTEYAPECLNKYVFDCKDYVSGANAFSADTLVSAFYSKTSLFRCYSVERNTARENIPLSPRFLVVQIDLASLDELVTVIKED